MQSHSSTLRNSSLPLDYTPPDPSDICPLEYSNDSQRRWLFLTAIKHYKRPLNWFGSQSQKAVHAFVQAHVERCRMTLPRHQWEKVAVDVHRILSADLLNHVTQRGLSTFSAAAGRASGVARRARNEPRDNAIVKAWVEGQSMRSLAREHGKALSTIQNVIARRA